MSLWAQAEADLAETLEESEDFGKEIRLTDPAGTTETLHGQAIAISQTEDPETGNIILAPAASATLRIKSVLALFSLLPVGVAESSRKPWLVSFEDAQGMRRTYKVRGSHPDHVLGTVVLELEKWRSR